MYKLNISVENPMTGESIALNFQFDPVSLDVKRWADAYAPIRAAVDQLLAMEGTADVRRPVTL